MRLDPIDRHLLWGALAVMALGSELLEAGFKAYGVLVGRPRCPHHPQNLASECGGE